MSVTRFRYFEDPAPVIGKADFEWFYSGTLQINDDNKIPVKTKAIDVYINKLDVVLQSAPTGASVIVKFYKNGVLIDQVAVTSGNLTGTTAIARTLVTAGDKMTATITQIGSGNYGVTASMYARVTT
jgi:hypothetical protein